MSVELKDNFAHVTLALGAGAGRTAEETAEEIAANARGAAPRATGHLADDSIKVVPTADPSAFLVVASTADGEHEEYAALVEFGTGRTAPQPYFLPAVEVAAAALGGRATVIIAEELKS